MRFGSRLSIVLTLALAVSTAQAQPNRVKYNNQQLFLSGANLAWINFAGDIGPAPTDFATFGNTLLQMHDHGGNAVRWWLHTNGVSTPQFNDSGFVSGPGVNTISNLRQALDIAWQREVGVVLCLWSFDMLRTSNSATVLNRNLLLLTDTTYARAYIDSALIPMVDSLRGNPAIIAWEIFNEPEGMSTQFGWSDVQHVPMSDIQRFINLCAGAIHREDSTALVTSGAWSFKALTDVPVATVGKGGPIQVPPTLAETRAQALLLKEKYRSSLTPDEIIAHLNYVASLNNYDYYSDARLIAEGGDPKGYLDFFSVHYYSTIDGTADISPFHHPASVWGLTKPIVVAEFAMQNTLGVAKESLFDTLYQAGYAGALPWSWTDVNFSSQADMLAGMQWMWDHYRSDVDVNGIGGFWPNVSITSPPNDTTFADSVAIPIVAAASDSDGTVTSVKFYADSSLIGERTSEPFSITWSNAAQGQYVLSAVATDNQGHQRTSNLVHITVGIPPMTRLEAELATVSGTGITVKNDVTASGGKYLDMATSIGTVTWNVHNVQGAGNYPIAFGVELRYDHPKTQYVNVNGVRTDTVEFDGTSTSTWMSKSINVDLLQGDNTIQMELSWGWMYLDYLSVPTNVLTSVADRATGVPAVFSLEQNYPNPFNPKTVISSQLTVDSRMKLAVYDLLGREVAVLADGRYPAGRYSFTFDATRLASGTYFYRLEAGGKTMVK
ncbi:MAG: Ig-like domain-containing protein [Bacteroidota bacterium]